MRVNVRVAVMLGMLMSLMSVMGRPWAQERGEGESVHNGEQRG